MKSESATTFILKNMRLLDCETAQYHEDVSVVIEGDKIKEVASSPSRSGNFQEIDLGGRVLMPGLIDAHVHVTAHTMNLSELPNHSPYWVSAKAAEVMKGMLNRGFTTVRDAGGADYGLRDAVDEGLITGPRLFVSGKVLTPTGGNNDYRPRTMSFMPCPCCSGGMHAVGRVVDGDVEVRKATRDELRRGADQIKCNASGGVNGPNGNMFTCNFSLAELRCMVEEAEDWGKYAMAHAYTPKTMRRAIEAGFRSIEHGNFADTETAQLMADKGVFVVPTLAALHVGVQFYKELGFPELNAEKLRQSRDVGLDALNMFRDHGVKIGFGTDLTGSLHEHQSEEFTIRQAVQSPKEIIASATVVNAEIMQQSGRLGVIAPGAFADMIAVDADPLQDISVLMNQGSRISAIIKDGEFYKNRL